MKSPCKDCPERYIGCHSECSRYKHFRRVIEAEKETITRNKAKMYNFPKKRKTR